MRDGERVGKVTDKDRSAITIDVRHGLLHHDEMYVPHFAIARVDGDNAYLKWNRDQVVDAYEHFSKYHRGT